MRGEIQGSGEYTSGFPGPLSLPPLTTMLNHYRSVLAWSVTVLAHTFLLSGCSGQSPVDQDATRTATAALEPNSIRDALTLATGVRLGPDFEQNPREYEPAFANDYYPNAVAFDGTNYLVVWQAWGSSSTAQALYAARVTPQMEVLDRQPIELAVDNAMQMQATAASDGSGFLVGYLACSANAMTPGTGCELRLKRIAANGSLIDQTPLVLAGADRDNSGLVLSSNGQGYLATWIDQPAHSYTDPYYIKGALIDDQAAAPLGPKFDIAETHASTVGCSVHLTNTASRSNYLVAWTEPNGPSWQSGFDLAATRVTPAGHVLAASTTQNAAHLVLGASSNSGIAAASDGQDFLVTWADFTLGTDGKTYEKIFGSRLSSQGAFQDPTPLALGDGDNTHQAPMLAYTGKDYFLVWSQYDPTLSGRGWLPRGTTVHTDGTVTAPQGLSLFGDRPESSILTPPQCPGGHCFLSWASGALGTSRSVFATAYDPGKAPDPAAQPTLVSFEPRNERLLDAACSKLSCRAVWTEERHEGGKRTSGLLTASLDLGGRLQPGSAQQLAAPIGDSGAAAVASNGDSFLVTWWVKNEDYSSRILAQQFDSKGHPGPQGPAEIALPYGWTRNLKVASTGLGYLVVFPAENASSMHTLRGVTLAKDGSLINPQAFSIEGAYATQLDLGSLVASPSQYLLVYSRSTFTSGSAEPSLVARLDADGHLIEGSTQQLLSPDGQPAVATSAASNGKDFLVSWRSPSDPSLARGSVVSQSGSVTPLLDPLSPEGSYGSLAWDGNAYLWGWAINSWAGIAVSGQHFTEVVPLEDGHLRTRDSAVANPWVNPTPFITPSSAGILWSYASPTGHPELHMGSPWRIHRSVLSGLCFGDPLGDQNGNGICDSQELPVPPITGAGGAAGASGGATSSAGGDSGSLGGQASTGTSSEAGAGGTAPSSAEAGGSLGEPEAPVVGGNSGTGGSNAGTTGGPSSGVSTGGEGLGNGSGGAAADSADEGASSAGTNRDDPGCGCRMAETQGTPSWGFAGLLAGILGRRKRRPRAAQSTI